MTTTVGELFDFLGTQPRDRLVIMAKDAEGNYYSPLDTLDEGMYLPETTWSGQVYLSAEELDEKIREYPEQGWSEDDAAPDGAVRVVVLGPVN